jgi:flagellar biosynthetic protein FlhB
MSEEDTGQSKSEQPTPKKQADSRKKGQVARSRELNTTLMLLIGVIGLWMLMVMSGGGLQQSFSSLFKLEQSLIFEPAKVLTHLKEILLNILWLITPFFLITVLASFIGPLIMGGWVFSVEALAPKGSRMSPIAGFKRMFGAQGFVEMIKALAKFVVIGGVAGIGFYLLKDTVLSLGKGETQKEVAEGMQLMAMFFVLLTFALISISFIDVPFQIHQHLSKLKMSMQEIKDENKQTNGNPEVKGRIRALQHEASQRRMLGDIAESDVVITNPDHYSVALKYEQDSTAAPTVVAKGIDHMAFRIREIARAHEVELVPAPPLARALYRSTEIGHEIPDDLYIAVAQVLAYVYRMRDASVYERPHLAGIGAIEVPPHYETQNNNNASVNVNG